LKERVIPWTAIGIGLSVIGSMLGFWVRTEVRFTQLETKMDAAETARQQLHDFEKADYERRLDILENRRRH
jgi:hypothetical protein